jgi:hypothetical protein
MADPELPTLPSGEPIVDALIEAYNGKRWPNEFQERYGVPWEPVTEEANVARNRVGAIPFAPYWGEKFQNFRDNYNGNVLGFFAVTVFDAAKTEEGDDLVRSVATELGTHFSDRVLEAELDLPGLQDIPIEVPRLSSLATFLQEQKAILGDGRLYPIEPISDSWIKLTHSIVVQNTWEHHRTLAGLTAAYVEEGEQAMIAIEEFASVGGEASAFELPNRLSRGIARSLGFYFPQLVISHLTETVPAGPNQHALTTPAPILPRTVS